MIIRNVLVMVLITAGVGEWIAAFLATIWAMPHHSGEHFALASILMALARIVWLMETPK